jgi:hypothetical protein
MRIKLLVVLCLSVSLFLVGCGKDNANTNTNSNTAVVAPATPVTKTNESATVDPNLKAKTETALKAKGCNDVTVDTSTTPKATLRGTVPKGKMTECIQAAQEAAGKPFENQVSEK